MSIDAVLRDLKTAIAPDGLRTGDAIGEKYLGDWFVTATSDGSKPLALTLPRTVSEVSDIMRVCHHHSVPVVPQGGLTGLAGGATPSAGCVIISLERMRTIEEIDDIANTITVQAGVPLQVVQEAADAADLFYPLDIGGRGSCQIGGNIATNAGGNRVLKYGMTRDLVLGLEVVLPDGSVVTDLNKMLKNNTGYDWKQLFVGSEGTLGIITRAVLRLFPKPLATDTALCSFEKFDDVYCMLRMARSRLGSQLSAFELMWPDFYEKAAHSLANPPLAKGAAAYLLIESSGTDPAIDGERFLAFMEGALSDGIVSDAVVAQSVAETQALWAIRDSSGEMVQALKPLVNFDVSIETSQINEFVNVCRDRLQARWPSAEAICFGHLADSNLHMFATTAERPFPEHEIEEIVYGTVQDFGGSISAEHGIGLLKRPYLGFTRSEEELKLMATIKRAIDPDNLLNPGKILDSAKNSCNKSH